MELIKFIANKVVTDLKQKAENSYKEMNDWLGIRFLKEMKSIENMSDYVKYSIEHKQKLKLELTLQQDEFIIESDIVIMRTPSPPPRPDPIESITVELFSIESLRKMYNQFKLVAPEGLISVKTFTEIFNDLILLNYGSEVLPDQWSNLTQSQIEFLAKMLASGSEFVDWRHWLLAACVPWPFPTQTQLLEMLDKYKKADRVHSGFISKSTFMHVS